LRAYGAVVHDGAMRLTPHALAGAGLSGVLVLGCAREATPAPQVSAVSAPMTSSAPASAAPAPAQPPSATDATSGAAATPAAPSASPCAEALPEDDWLERNLAETAITGLAEVVSASKTDLGGKGLVKHRYEVRVLEWFVGTGPERLVLTEGAEADAPPRPTGKLLFFSACTESSGVGYSPDTAYFYSVDPACREDVQARVAALAKRIPKKTKNATPAACKRP